MSYKLPPPVTRREVRSGRGPKEAIDPQKTIAQWDEFEVAKPSQIVPTRVVLLAGSECRFTCTMCDLWRHTLDHATSPGDLITQIDHAIREPWHLPLPVNAEIENLPQHWIKLYNSSNFFDPYNVPTTDLIPIASRLNDFERVIVENHPRLTSESTLEFSTALKGQLEIAMGLETADPAMLRWLNKGMTLDDFQNATRQLQHWSIDIRVFLLLGLPGTTYSESLQICLAAIEFAGLCGVRHCSIIPTRTDHGPLHQLSSEHRVPLITAHDLEVALATMVEKSDAIITVDLWNWEKLPGHCSVCRIPRKERLERMCILQKQIPLDNFDCNCIRL